VRWLPGTSVRIGKRILWLELPAEQRRPSPRRQLVVATKT
jgi:hypothetical protein